MMKIRQIIPQKAVNYLKHLPLAIMANLYYRFPARNLKIIGVTGTEGKTTTVNLLGHILSESGLAVATVSTVSAKFAGQEIDTGLHVTSPGPWPLQKLLRKFVNKKIKYVVLETTSNGLDQFRFWGVHFQVGVLTNLTHDHLDYHKTIENYRRAKLKLFQMAKIAILNQDDPVFVLFKEKLKNKKIISYGLTKEADINSQNYPFKTSLLGEYNRYNCLAAISAASLLGLDKESILKAIASFSGVKGRLEEIDEGQNFKVYVDFAHTPNSLSQALKTLRETLKDKQKLIVVFGSAGRRDSEKRPLMGKEAANYADMIILTTDDPRDEKVEDICQQIAGGINNQVPFKIIPDRTEAIKDAFSQAQKGDIVALCGKGHEQTLAIGTAEIPWSDQETARKLLRGVSKVSKVSEVSKGDKR